MEQIKIPLTDAQRQQRRRDKLKKQAQIERFNPAPYLGLALKELVLSGEVGEELLSKLKSKAVVFFAASSQLQKEGPSSREVLIRYFSSLVDSYFDKEV